MTAAHELRIDERIARLDDRLSPQERRAAATLLAHLDDLATYRAGELALIAGVSKATMSRLFRSLGFSSFDEVRRHLRAVRAAGAPRATGEAPDLAEHRAREAAAIDRVTTAPGLAEAVSLLADARTVTVAGWRTSHPVALHLRQQLAHARPDVRLAPLPGQVVGEELADLGPGDLVVAVGFRRRPAGFAAFLSEARATGADLLLLADPTAVLHAAHATVWLECPVETGLAYDSYGAAMSLIGVLCHGVLLRAGDAGRDRVAAITRAYERLEEIE